MKQQKNCFDMPFTYLIELARIIHKLDLDVFSEFLQVDKAFNSFVFS